MNAATFEGFDRAVTAARVTLDISDELSVVDLLVGGPTPQSDSSSPVHR